MVCYDGRPMTSGTRQRVYIEWVFADFYGVVNEVLVRPGEIVQSGQWLVSVDEQELATIEEEGSDDLLADYFD